MQEIKSRDNAVVCPKCHAAFFESKGKCPKCGTPYEEGAVSKSEKAFNEAFEDMNNAARKAHLIRNKYRPHGVVSVIIAVLLFFASCGGQQRGQQEEIINDVDIPRTHFGITLGASYTEVRPIIQKKIDYKNWLWNTSEGREEMNRLEAKSRGKDEPVSALLDERWAGTSDGPFEEIDEKHKIIELSNNFSFYNHYDELNVEFFDGEVVLIAIELPFKLVDEIVNKLFEKYPFQSRRMEWLTTIDGNSRQAGWPKMCHLGGGEEWFCSNGKTEIAIRPPIIVYRDVELMRKKKAHWDELNDLDESERRNRAEKAVEDY